MTTTLAHRPSVTVHTVPAYDPPFDDEVDNTSGWAAMPVQPTLPPVPPAPHTPRPRARPSQPGHTRAVGSPVTTNPSPETRTAVARFMNTCLEVLNGYRPAGHLRTLASPSHAGTVVDAMTRATRRVARVIGTPAGTGTAKLRIRRMRICQPRPGVAEISVVLGSFREGTAAGGTAAGGAPDGGRCWAAAFRLERRHGNWRCTVARLL